MKVNFSTLSNLSTFTNYQNNYQNSPIQVSKPIQNDVFVKSSNNISFNGVNKNEKVKPEHIYSNAQIENIILRKLPQNCTQQDFVNIIKSTTPSITNSITDKFEYEKCHLEKRR